MKWRHLKVVGFMVLACAVMCAVVYAHKHEGKKSWLPDAVKAAIAASYPGAEIEEVEKECEGVKLYEVELEQNEKEMEVTFAKDGAIVEVETKVSMESLPKAVSKAITEAAAGAKIKKVEKEVIYAVVKLVKLDTPKTVYEAKLIKGGKKGEIEVAADGTVLEQPRWKKHKKDECDDDDEDD